MDCIEITFALITVDFRNEKFIRKVVFGTWAKKNKRKKKHFICELGHWMSQSLIYCITSVTQKLLPLRGNWFFFRLNDFSFVKQRFSISIYSCDDLINDSWRRTHIWFHLGKFHWLMNLIYAFLSAVWRHKNRKSAFN